VNIGDIFFALRGDGAPLQVDAKKAAEAAGAAAGMSFNKKFGGALRAASGAAGAGMGLAFAAATKGALELNEASSQFKAQTGANAEEAKAFSSTLISLNKVNVQSISEIGDTLTALKLHFDLTGEAAQAVAEQMLDFSRIVGVDGATAAKYFDELIDAGVTTVDKMSDTMDKLTYSHQKFGVPIGATIEALVKFAPAMNAVNLSTDQAIGLMNLLTESGLDAASASKAFNFALTKIKSPEELNRLMADIAATSNDFDRSQKAAALFGKKAGRGMAIALQPGQDSLESFMVTTEEATGAVKRAGDELDNSFGNRAKLILKQFSGALAEVGTSMGDLLLVAALLGPQFTRLLAGAVGGLAGWFGPKLLAAILPGAISSGAAAGTAAGTAFGPAMAAGVALAAITIPVTLLLIAKGPLADWLGFGEAAPGQMGGPFKVPDTTVIQVPVTPDEEVSAQAFREYLQNLPEGVTGLDYSAWKAAGAKAGDALVGGAIGAADDGSGDFENEAEAAGTKAGQALTTAVSKEVRSWRIAPEQVTAMFAGTVDGVREAAKWTGAAGMEAMAAGITAARQKPLDAFDSLKEMLKNAMSPTQEAARIAGQLTSTELAKGLRSKDPAVKAQAIAVRRELVARLEDIKKDAGTIGGKAMDELNKGVASKDASIRRTAGLARDAVVSTLQGAKPGAYTAGVGAAESFIRGMIDSVPAFLRSALKAKLHEAGVPGYAMGSWFVPATTLATVHAGEMIIPAAPSAAIRAGAASVTAAGVVPGRTQEITIEHVDIRDAHDEFSLIQQLRFLAAVG